MVCSIETQHVQGDLPQCKLSLVSPVCSLRRLEILGLIKYLPHHERASSPQQPFHASLPAEPVSSIYFLLTHLELGELSLPCDSFHGLLSLYNLCLVCVGVCMFALVSWITLPLLLSFRGSVHSWRTEVNCQTAVRGFPYFKLWWFSGLSLTGVSAEINEVVPHKGCSLKG